MESKKLQKVTAQEEALMRHAMAEVRWQQWGEKARQQAMHKVLIIISALQIRSALFPTGPVNGGEISTAEEKES